MLMSLMNKMFSMFLLLVLTSCLFADVKTLTIDSTVYFSEEDLQAPYRQQQIDRFLSGDFSEFEVKNFNWKDRYAEIHPKETPTKPDYFKYTKGVFDGYLPDSLVFKMMKIFYFYP